MSRPLLAVAVLVALLLSKSAVAAELLIIANPSVDSTTPLTLNEIAAIYLLRTTVWADGSHIVPVNREATSDIRVKFTDSVLRQDNANIAVYWNEMHFMGKQPPVVQESEPAMLAFIQKVPGSVGYINASTQPVNVKVLARVP
jgi:ABC-type phosphate transport system substrate-binding protein